MLTIYVTIIMAKYTFSKGHKDRRQMHKLVDVWVKPAVITFSLRLILGLGKWNQVPQTLLPKQQLAITSVITGTFVEL